MLIVNPLLVHIHPLNNVVDFSGSLKTHIALEKSADVRLLLNEILHNSDHLSSSTSSFPYVCGTGAFKNYLYSSFVSYTHLDVYKRQA